MCLKYYIYAFQGIDPPQSFKSMEHACKKDIIGDPGERSRKKQAGPIQEAGDEEGAHLSDDEAGSDEEDESADSTAKAAGTDHYNGKAVKKPRKLAGSRGKANNNNENGTLLHNPLYKDTPHQTAKKVSLMPSEL